MNKEFLALIGSVVAALVSVVSLLLSLATRGRLARIERKVERKHVLMVQGIQDVQEVLDTCTDLISALEMLAAKCEVGAGVTTADGGLLSGLAKARELEKYANKAELVWGPEVAAICRQLYEEAGTNLHLRDPNNSNSPRNKIARMRPLMLELQKKVKLIHDEA